MMNLATVGYSLAAIAFFILAILLKTSWRGGWRGGLLVSAVIITIGWASLASYGALHEYPTSIKLAILELLRYAAFLGFLFLLLLTRTELRNPISRKKLRNLAILVSSILLLMIGVLSYADLAHASLPAFIGYNLRIFSHIIVSVIGLLLIEQLFRNSTPQQRWNIKYLCLGLGGIFAYDFYLYSDAFLLNQIDLTIWGARGYINAMVVPLLAVSAARNPDWSLEIHVSRKFVFHSTTLMAAGIYLLAMAGAGYYIRLYGGDWGGIAQVTFLFGAILVLAMLMFSGTMRAKVRLFLSQNFFNYRYDYREEWLRFINTLSDEKLDTQLRERVINAVGEIIDSPGGCLWQAEENGLYRLSACINMTANGSQFNHGSQALVQFLTDKQWVVNLEEYEQEPEVYEGLDLPDWIADLPQAWLIVPLFQQNQLYGFMVLAHSRARRKINWEERDLLITTGRGATNYLALLDANEALFNARQFEAFNRLSAYVVHDLKNVIAQLALVVKNATKHKHNPAFMDDAINTVDNAVSRMNRMLAQLRKDRAVATQTHTSRIDVVQIVTKVVQHRQSVLPSPTFESEQDKLMITADADRLESVIEHLVQNAQEATQEVGYVTVRLYIVNQKAIIEIKDNGSGMDTEFIRERLFKPFETTKGNAGMGIGVYESREFVQSIGGTMEVESRVGMGTTFTIRLPLEDCEAVDQHHTVDD